MMNITTKNRGFSMIEVMVALVILAVGILGISKLQGVLIKNSSNANQRTIAVSLAQQKIDDLKSFVLLNADVNGDNIDDAWTSGITWPVTQQSFAFIANNKGGKIDSADWGNEIVIGNYAYKLDWTVNPFYYPASSTTTPTSTPIGESSDYKQVTVVVKWKDELGAEQTINLATVISAYDPSVTALSSNTSTGGEGPKVAYTPELAPDVIDIEVDVGSGKKRQTSKPLPDAVKTGQDSNTMVNFDVVTYLQAGSGFIAERQEEFVTVDCRCNLSTLSASAYPPGHAFWDGVERYDIVGLPIIKATATQVNNANAVDAVCGTCCRDHHDNTASAVKYVVAGPSTGDHPHYKANGDPATSGQEYIESCRLKRIDGILRVFQDWSLKDITVMDRASLSDGSQLQTDYVAYQKDFILQSVASAGTGVLKPALRTPISTTVGSQQQLEARGIYIDKVYDESGTENPASYISYIQNASNLDRLDIIPFSEVNLSLLTIWTSTNNPPDTNPKNVTVTSEPVATVVDPANDYYGTYSRGWIKALVQATPAANITATIRDDNDGLTQIRPLLGTKKSDTVVVNVAAAIGAKAITGTYSINFGTYNTNTPTIAITGGGTCTLFGSNAYSCNVTAPWTGSIQISVAVTTGNPTKRCTGTSLVYYASGLSVDTTHNFAQFSCN
jgi:prepilin-type N-terminal cleavage/methylation domain-containing protein